MALCMQHQATDHLAFRSKTRKPPTWSQNTYKELPHNFFQQFTPRLLRHARLRAHPVRHAVHALPGHWKAARGHSRALGELRLQLRPANLAPLSQGHVDGLAQEHLNDKKDKHNENSKEGSGFLVYLNRCERRRTTTKIHITRTPETRVHPRNPMTYPLVIFDRASRQMPRPSDTSGGRRHRQRFTRVLSGTSCYYHTDTLV